MRAWHVVCSRPQQEARAAIELAKQDFDVFLPILDQKPMFPRYLFVAFDVAQDNWGCIRSTRGCVDLLKNGFLPATVPDHIMSAIRAYKPLEASQDDQTEFSAGQAITITSGPLAGLQGLFVADRHKRVYALLEIMGRKVEVARDSIRAA